LNLILKNKVINIKEKINSILLEVETKAEDKKDVDTSILHSMISSVYNKISDGIIEMSKSKNFDWFFKNKDELINQAKKLLSKFYNKIDKLYEYILKKIEPLFIKVTGYLSSDIKNLEKPTDKEAVKKKINKLNGIFDKVKSIMKNPQDDFFKYSGLFLAVISLIVMLLRGTLTKVITNFAKVLGMAFQGVIDSLQKSITSFIRVLKDLLGGNPMNAIKTFFAELGKLFGNIVYLLFSPITSFLQTLSQDPIGGFALALFGIGIVMFIAAYLPQEIINYKV